MSPRPLTLNIQMREETLKKIHIAAMKVFTEYGYQGATMKKIAQETGLSYGLVYHYYPSKEAVFRFLLDQSMDQARLGLEELVQAPGFPSAWLKLETLSQFLLSSSLECSAASHFLLVLHGLTQTRELPDLRDHVSRKIELYYQTLAPLIVQGQEEGTVREGDPVTLAAAYFSFLQGLALLNLQKNNLIRNVTAVALLGVLKK